MNEIRDYYRVLIVGNYLPELSTDIRSKLTAKLMRTRTLVTGYAHEVVVLQPVVPTALGGLSGRIADSLHYGKELFELNEESIKTIDLIIQIKFDTSEDEMGETLTEKLESEYEAAIAPYEELDKSYELVIPVTKQHVYLIQSRPKLTPIETPVSLTNDPFGEVKHYRDKVAIEQTDSGMDRDNIPNNLGVAPDMNKAGGLQQT